MTREQMIEHWSADIIPAVFKADDAIRAKWLPILQEAKFHDDDKEYKEKVAKDYCRALAEEIVRGTTDEELSKL